MLRSCLATDQCYHIQHIEWRGLHSDNRSLTFNTVSEYLGRGRVANNYSSDHSHKTSKPRVLCTKPWLGSQRKAYITFCPCTSGNRLELTPGTPWPVSGLTSAYILRPFSCHKYKPLRSHETPKLRGWESQCRRCGQACASTIPRQSFPERGPAKIRRQPVQHDVGPGSLLPRQSCEERTEQCPPERNPAVADQSHGHAVVCAKC